MSSPEPAPLPAWVANPALVSCWARVRSRFEANGLVASGRTVVQPASREERHALGELLGRTITRDRVSVDLAPLDTRLRERSGAGGLLDVLPRVTGEPLSDRPAKRAEQAARRDAPLELARALLAQAWVEQWVDGLRRTGLLTNRADAATVVRDAVAVLRVLVTDRLPVAIEGPRSRVELAASVVGDAHALDEDRMLTQVVLRGLAAASARPVPTTASSRRELWDEYAVAPDLLSRTCLILGLSPAGDDPLSTRLRLAAEAGDPVHVTDWDLRRVTGTWSGRGRDILVCENPRVLEAVAQRHGRTQSVVCLSGEPNTVVTALLHRLVVAGLGLRYHGDFDWPGVAIANRLVDRYGAVPWRMGPADYERAARPDGPLLSGTPVEPSWDPELGAAMRAFGRALHEESVLPELLDALGS